MTHCPPVRPRPPARRRLDARAAAWTGLLCGALCTPLAAPANVVDTTSLAEALALARQKIQVPAGARVEVEPGTLDPRLRLAPCAKVEPYLPTGTRPWGRTRVGLRCVSGPVRWNVYLPVTVRVFAPAVVLRSPRVAGALLDAEDLEISEVDVAASSSPVFTNAQDVVGRTLATALPAGATLRGEHLRLRQWFSAGDTVTIVAIGPGYAVSGEGTALGHGLEGQPVRVRTDSGRVITGAAVSTRRVEVPM